MFILFYNLCATTMYGELGWM